MNVLTEKMTWPEIRDAISNGADTIIIPAGSVEQHGPHLPVSTDTILGEHAAEELAIKLGNALVAPVIRPALSSHHMKMPGTVTLKPETFALVVRDYLECYVAHGFANAVLMASHGGNCAELDRLAEKYDGVFNGMRVKAVHEVPTNADLDRQTDMLGLRPGTNNGHADDRETSEMLKYAPELVHMDRATAGYTGAMDAAALDRFFTEGVTSLSGIGVVGDPTAAEAGRGSWYVEETQKRLTENVRKALDGGE